MSWSYAVIGPDGSTIGPLADQPFVPLLSDEFYAAMYDDLKQKYRSPLITTDGTDQHRVWLFRYDTDNASGNYPIYPIVWESVSGRATSSPDASTVLAASTPLSQIAPPAPSTGGGPVTVGGGPATITSTGVASPTVQAAPSAPVAATPKIGAGTVVVVAAVALGVAWAAGWLK